MRSRVSLGLTAEQTASNNDHSGPIATSVPGIVFDEAVVINQDYARAADAFAKAGTTLI